MAEVPFVNSTILTPTLPFDTVVLALLILIRFFFLELAGTIWPQSVLRTPKMVRNIPSLDEKIRLLGCDSHLIYAGQ